MELRWWLIGFWLLFFGLAMALPTYRIYRQTGVNPYRLGNTDSAHDFIGRLFRLVMLGSAVAVAIYAWLPLVYGGLGRLLWLERPILEILGLGLLGAALVWILMAQAQMGRSWRIGIDSENPTGLVQNGVFGRSRNPIFLGMRLMLLGFFLVMPNALTLALGLLGDALMQIQVRLAEEHLLRLHGQDYRNYKQQVPRWL